MAETDQQSAQLEDSSLHVRLGAAVAPGRGDTGVRGGMIEARRCRSRCPRRAVALVLAVALLRCSDPGASSVGDGPVGATQIDAVGGAEADVSDTGSPMADDAAGVEDDGPDTLADAEEGSTSEGSDSGRDGDAPRVDGEGAGADEDGAPDDDSTRCSGPAPTTYGEDLPPDRLWRAAELSPCAPAAHAMVVPSGATWWVEGQFLPADGRVFVYDARYIGADTEGRLVPPPLARSDFAGRDGEARVEFTAPRSGEYVAVFERDEGATNDEYEARAICAVGCDLEATRYPVVLVHGYAGVDSYFGILDYFYDIHDPLEAAGYEVFTPVVDPIATSARRSAQLAEQVDEILLETGARRVNMIAHSQGGLDVRMLISGLGYGDRVASLTTIATPHLGVPAVLFEFFSIQSFSVETMGEFNARYVDDPRVRYWSWSARSCRMIDLSCQRDADGEVIEPFLVATFNVLARYGDNDGIVPTEAMFWGEHLGQLNADHFDEVGQIADRSRDGDPFDHRAFYRSEVRRLAAVGF